MPRPKIKVGDLVKSFLTERVGIVIEIRREGRYSYSCKVQPNEEKGLAWEPMWNYRKINDENR